MDMNSELAHEIIYSGLPLIRKEFDSHLSRAIGHVCDAIDKAYAKEKEIDATVFPGIISEDQKRYAYVLVLNRTALNHVIFALESLRSGYLDVSQAISRSAIEALAMAILAHRNKELYSRYHSGKFSVNKAVRRLGKKELIEVYEYLNKIAHPTMNALYMHSPRADQGYPLGGYFDIQKMGDYRKQLENLGILADNVRVSLAAIFKLAP